MNVAAGCLAERNQEGVPGRPAIPMPPASFRPSSSFQEFVEVDVANELLGVDVSRVDR
jgi:hypothetical protein